MSDIEVRPDIVIVSAPLPANLALHQATSTISIVMATGADPVDFGLVQSLSHPGGNVTAQMYVEVSIDDPVCRSSFIPKLAIYSVFLNVMLRKFKFTSIISPLSISGVI